MQDVKKKLSSFIPTSARAQLQNVLTVEWDTHKTVLVEVPGADGRPSEMEMSGMDRGRADNYGRLADDDEEMEGLFNRSNFTASASRGGWSDETSSSSRDRDRASSSREASKTKKRPPPLASRPYAYRPSDENPFDETSPSYLASTSSGISRSGYTFDTRAPETPERRQHSSSSTTWATFGEQGKQQRQITNPWGAGGEWSQSSSQTASPSSSRGTRESALYDAEDPFR